MKKRILVFGVSALFFACGNNTENKEATNQPVAKVQITIKGSDTVLPLTQMEAEKFMNKNKNAEITVVGGGSGVGITALTDGNTDIAMSSRDLKTEEKLKFTESGKDIKSVLVAYDALAVIVHPSNKVTKLTRKQIEDIYTGKIANWKDIGGDDMKIVAYSRESSSGTYEFFKEHVLDKKNYGNETLMMPATGAIVQSVAQTEGAIGYIGIAYETKDVKPLSVSYDDGKTFVEPSVASAKDKSYPISRPLFYFYDAVNSNKVMPFIDFIVSAEGQAIVSEVGYVPLN